LPAETEGLGIPFLISRISVIHGIFLHEFLFISYVVFHIIFFRKNFSIDFGNSKPVKRLALMIFLLGTATINSNLVNILFGYEQPLIKIAEGFRLYLTAIFVICVYSWTIRFGGLFVCKNYLLGFILSGLLHLYFSAKLLFRELGGLPSLIGQNGPGPGFALALLFCAVLIHFSRSRSDVLIALSSLPISVYGIVVSYSKISMLIGIISFVVLSLGVLKNMSIKNFPKYSLIFFIVSCVVIINFKNELGNFLDGAKIYYEYKFGHDVITKNESTTNV